MLKICYVIGKRLDKNAIKYILSAFGWLDLCVITSETRQNISVFFVIKKQTNHNWWILFQETNRIYSKNCSLYEKSIFLGLGFRCQVFNADISVGWAAILIAWTLIGWWLSIMAAFYSKWHIFFNLLASVVEEASD